MATQSSHFLCRGMSWYGDAWGARSEWWVDKPGWLFFLSSLPSREQYNVLWICCQRSGKVCSQLAFHGYHSFSFLWGRARLAGVQTRRYICRSSQSGGIVQHLEVKEICFEEILKDIGEALSKAEDAGLFPCLGGKQGRLEKPKVWRMQG